MALEPPEPQAIVVFGASGDLAKKKILPALYNLSLEGLLPTKRTIIGFSLAGGWDDEAFRRHAREAVEGFSRTPIDEKAFAEFAGSLGFIDGTFDDDSALARLDAALKAADESLGLNGARLYYLAVPPPSFSVIVDSLAKIGQNTPASRIVIEKPFGHDLASAQELTEQIHTAFNEPQIFRIDHYLGKETVQNITVFRFANSLFERVWNRDAIDHVQLTVAESIGVEGRAGYYEQAGATRDLLQNHMLQVLAFLTMEPPRSLDPEAFRDEKVKVLRTIRPIQPQDSVRGQYEGYRDEPGVAPSSETETYIAVKVMVDNWRWEGAPFFLRHGKELPERNTEITVAFRGAPDYLFREIGIDHVPHDHITIRIQPHEGISLAFEAKEPGSGIELKTVRMDFDYERSFKHEPAEAYERLIHDAMDGDHTLFTRDDGVDACWRVVTPLLEDPGRTHLYRAGSWGPAEADELIAPRHWHLGGHTR
jgi:glucose-6-phosphate 1-dehydrogenase